MATHSTTFGLSLDLASIEDCDKELQSLINDVHLYLYHFGNNWFFHALGKSYFQKCCRSWVRVSTHLEKFLLDPRSNYSMLMVVLDHEMHKFPQNSFFGKELRTLSQLIAMGPNFSITSIH
ncbi:MAG: hypothetical protein JSR17_05090 [Proteobacteria bacterium]|nr:hypothetical protein [Pseudomonadota bacterium]